MDPDEPSELFAKALDEARNRKSYASAAGISRALRTCKSASRLMIEDFRRRAAGCKGLEDQDDDDEPIENDDSADSNDDEDDGGANAGAGNGVSGEFEVLVRRSAMSFTAGRLEVPPPASRQGPRGGTPGSSLSSSFTTTLTGASSWQQLPLGPGGPRGGVASASQVPLFDGDVVGPALASAGDVRLDGGSSGGSFSSKAAGSASASGRVGLPARAMTAARQRPAAGMPLAPTPRAALQPAPRDSVSSGGGTTAAAPASTSTSCSGGACGSVSGGGGCRGTSGGAAGGGTRNPALMLKMIEAAAASQAARRSGAAAGSSAARARGVQRSCPNLCIPLSVFDEAVASAPAAYAPADGIGCTTTSQRGAGAASPPASPAGADGTHNTAAAAVPPVPTSPSSSATRGIQPARAPSRLGLNAAAAAAAAAAAGAEDAGSCSSAGMPPPRGGGTLNGYGCSSSAASSAPGLSFILPQPPLPQPPQPQPPSSNSNAVLGGGAPLTTSGSGEAAFVTDGEDGRGALSPPVRRLRSITAAAAAGASAGASAGAGAAAGAGTGGSLSTLMGGLGSGGVISCGGRPVTPGTGAIAVSSPTAESWRTRQLSPGGKLLHVQATRSPPRRSTDIPLTAAGPPSPVGLGGRIARGSASFDLGSRPLAPAAGAPGGPAAASLTSSGGGGGGGSSGESAFASRLTAAPGAAEACGGATAGLTEPGGAWRGSVSSRSFTSVKAGGGALTLAPAVPGFGRFSSPPARSSGTGGAGSSARAGLLQPLAATACSGGGLDSISELAAAVPEGSTPACNARAPQPQMPSTPSPGGSGAGGRASPALLVPHPPTAPPPSAPSGAASPLSGFSRRSMQARAAVLLCPSPSGSSPFECRSDASSLKCGADDTGGGGASDTAAAADTAAGSPEQGPGTPVPSGGSRPGVMERLRGLFV
ncbi:hypothetical protein HYH02_004037 [Chlamydomonas schloesseri]|uniref:Uncharacterized protein n=1 Tax=Chlamydomonas schloesseri TaxID=2026947 RepID=A0A835WP51_9CHLO|nr:hypothetical protein HYH02_004037 [Chlamydomonas schloesseri]|eukprot:KAG2451439.1 hypothetical protein HYH02_004037 [Chlamydomonas schloesseri]